MRGALLERMPPFENNRIQENDKIALTNGVDASPDNQALLNDFTAPNNNANENYESVRI